MSKLTVGSPLRLEMTAIISISGFCSKRRFMQLADPHEATLQATMNLAEIANVRDGELIQVRTMEEPDDLYQRTIRLLSLERDEDVQSRKLHLKHLERGEDEFVPDNEHLRTVFLFAEAVGGYEKLHDLVYAYSPGLNLIESVRDTVAATPMRPLQLRDLTNYREQILEGLKTAHDYLQDYGTDEFSRDDVRQLYELLTEAQSRADEILRILGLHLMHEVEEALVTLHMFREKMRSVEETITGVFLVESEVMFIPPNELIRCVDAIFRGVSNPHLANNINGVTLLAARNLLIQVVAFYSYYGKNQIYKMLRRSGATQSTVGIAGYIRKEIGQIFEACQTDNRLVLRRIMREANEEFELSVEAIQREAETSAVQAVRGMLPNETPTYVPRKRAWWKRLLGIR